MNVYDFDGTIYDGDSTIDFYLFCLKRNKKIMCRLPYQANGALLYALKRISKTRFKEHFYSFLPLLSAPEETVRSFWEQSSAKIMPWYLMQKQSDDVVISASPAFLLAPVCRQLGIQHLIASEVDPHTGLYSGINCRGEEKVSRFRAQYKDAVIDNFYTDSLSDAPMAQIAQKSYLVQNKQPAVWKL